MKTLDLNGTWKLGYTDGERGRLDHALLGQIEERRYFDASVPGCVHLDMMKVGLIEEPTRGVNSLAARWIEECVWSYRKEFDVDEAMLGAKAWLYFGALDLNARLFLNGEFVGTHSNVFHPCRIEVSGRLVKGKNWVTVQIESGIIGAAEKPAEGYGGSHNAHDYAIKLHRSHWLRKPAFQFGWDWSTRFGNVGISGDVRLEYTVEPVRLGTLVPLINVSDDLKEAKITLRATAENLTEKPLSVVVRAEIIELGFTLEKTIEIEPGEHRIDLEGTVSGFELWWPVGTGEARLYELNTSVLVGDTMSGFPAKRIGFRKVNVNQDPHPDGGNYFIVEVNNRRIFLKGACWVPADMVMARIDDTRYDALIDRALEANFNFLRIWGGGLYESDHFYDRCDADGILVWQEFGFACKQYPLTDRELHTSVTDEARYQIRRLAEHPSLMIWCGNNEMEWGHWEWDFNKVHVMPDYGFFHFTLPRLLKEEDPTRYYQPSSPFSPDGASANLSDRGDQHDWHVSLNVSDFREFRKMDGRMVNEAGYLGPNSLPTLLECWPEGEEPEIGNFAWSHHDNSVDWWHRPSIPDQGFEQSLGRELVGMDVEDFVYLGGFMHGEALGIFCDNLRRRTYDSSAACFWMYNDCWPTTRSWTIVDYGLRRTPAFWAVRRCFATVRVVLVYNPDERVMEIYGINDSDAVIHVDLDYGICEFAGGYPVKKSKTVSLEANASSLIAKLPIDVDPAEVVDRLPFASLTDAGGEIVSRNRYIGAHLKDLKLAESDLKVDLMGGFATFTSSVLVLGVCLDLNGETALADNFFDVYPGQPYTIPWKEENPPKVLAVANSKLR